MHVFQTLLFIDNRNAWNVLESFRVVGATAGDRAVSQTRFYFYFLNFVLGLFGHMFLLWISLQFLFVAFFKQLILLIILKYLNFFVYIASVHFLFKNQLLQLFKFNLVKIKYIIIQFRYYKPII